MALKRKHEQNIIAFVPEQAKLVGFFYCLCG